MTTMPVDRGFYITSQFGIRSGGFHYGTDFGRDGGSGGYPIYAVKAGTVTRSGPASGFGQWITVDHPAGVGGGESVYGHIIPELGVGQFVREGQRIGRINPHSNTNGGVAPHLHLEFYRRSWVSAGQRVVGQTVLNPEDILRGAEWPDHPQQQEEEGGTVGTLIGIDVSEWQDGLDLTATGADFCIIRTNYGSAHLDWVAVSHITDWRRTGKPYAYYSWLRPNQPIEAQADAAKTIWDACGGGAGVWIDVEEEGITRTQVVAFRDALRRRGMYVIGAYSRANFWESLPGGEPSAEEGGGKIWVSHYGSRPDGPYRDIYPGDSSSIWLYPLGDRRPDLWQFTDLGRVPGWVKGVDVNAYKGTEAELRALFTGTTRKKEDSMSAQDVQNLKDYIDVRITGPIGSDVKDIRQQITGGRDAGDYRGWPQLGQDGQGRDLTVVDALAAARQDIATLTQTVNTLTTALLGKEK